MPAPAVDSTAPWIPPLYRARCCGARTRSGAPCRGAAVRGKRRCRMHGGAAGSGAQPGNRNAETHGYWGAAARAERMRVAALLAAGGRVLAALAARADEAGGGPASPARHDRHGFS